MATLNTGRLWPSVPLATKGHLLLRLLLAFSQQATLLANSSIAHGLLEQILAALFLAAEPKTKLKHSINF